MFTFLSFNYYRFCFTPEETASNINQIHFQPDGISEGESRSGIFNCFRENLVFQTVRANVKSSSLDIQIQFFCFTQQKLTFLAWHASKLLTKSDFVCWFRIETETEKQSVRQKTLWNYWWVGRGEGSEMMSSFGVCWGFECWEKMLKLRWIILRLLDSSCGSSCGSFNGSFSRRSYVCFDRRFWRKYCGSFWNSRNSMKIISSIVLKKLVKFQVFLSSNPYEVSER